MIINKQIQSAKYLDKHRNIVRNIETDTQNYCLNYRKWTGSTFTLKINISICGCVHACVYTGIFLPCYQNIHTIILFFIYVYCVSIYAYICNV